jgi:EpsI family protein
MNTWVRVGISCTFLIVTFIFLQSRSSGEATPLRRPLETFPVAIGEWRGQEETTLEESIRGILKLDDYVMRRYADPSGHSIWLYIGYWETQRRGAQIHSPKHCLPGGGWEPLEAKTVMIPVAAQATPFEVNHYIIQKDQYRQLVLYWYQSQGRAIASEVDAKVQLLKNALFHNRTDGALVRLISPVEGSVQETFARQMQYVQALYPLLGRYFPE